MTRAILAAPLLALAMLSAGCRDDRPAPPLTIVDRAPIRPNFPAECWDGREPEWEHLPDRATHLKETARNYRRNREAFGALKTRTAVCRAAMGAHGYGLRTSNLPLVKN